MPKTPVTICKFVGTVSLGLLTGLSYSLKHVAIPSLLSLPTATTCSQALSRLEQSTISSRGLLAPLALVPLSAAYIASPRYAKHPYLVWTVVVAAISVYGIEPLLLNTPLGAWCLPADAHVSADAHETTSVGSSGSDDGIEGVRGSWVGVKGLREAEEAKSEEEVNGEAVRSRVERWRAAEGVRASIAGLAFAMSIVGIWGDGY